MRYSLPIKKQQPLYKRRYVVVAGIALAGIAAICFIGWLFFIKTNSTNLPKKSTVQVLQNESLTSRIMFVGDVQWGRQTQRRAEASPLKYDYITSGLKAEDRAQYNAWIGNFECPVTSKDIPYSLQVSALKFNCRPEYLQTLAKYFTAASLANNHTDNNDGQWGLDETRKNLEQYGIQYFGTYNMSNTDKICEVISMPATTSGNRTVAIPLALCGYMYVVNRTPSDDELAVMQQYAKVMPVIAMPHMGVEYRSTAESEKIAAYHRMIDNGADVVIGAHPHVIQNSESYKGKLIAYSVGNFLFDQQSVSPETNLALAVGLKLTIPAGSASEAYKNSAKSCKAFNDDCLAKLQKTVKSRPKISVSYEYGCFSITSNVPVRGTEAECAKARTAATADVLTNLSGQW